jgi:rhodanese-related sulfurtransferase
MAWGAIFVMLVITTVSSLTSKIRQLSPQEMTFVVNREEGVVVDIRTENEFKQGHIIDAKHLPMTEVNNNNFSSLEKVKGKPIIVVCAAGLSAGKAAQSMMKAGFATVHILKGGMGAWTGGNLPVVKK